MIWLVNLPPRQYKKFQVFGRGQDGSYQAYSYGELRVLVSRWNIINTIINNIGLLVFQYKEENGQYFYRDCFYI